MIIPTWEEFHEACLDNEANGASEINALKLAHTLEQKYTLPLAHEAATELRRLHEVNQVLMEALRAISHSVKQARFGGNDWRRELNLCENIANETLAKAGEPT